MDRNSNDFCAICIEIGRVVLLLLLTESTFFGIARMMVNNKKERNVPRCACTFHFCPGFFSSLCFQRQIIIEFIIRHLCQNTFSILMHLLKSHAIFTWNLLLFSSHCNKMHTEPKTNNKKINYSFWICVLCASINSLWYFCFVFLQCE